MDDFGILQVADTKLKGYGGFRIFAYTEGSNWCHQSVTKFLHAATTFEKPDGVFFWQEPKDDKKGYFFYCRLKGERDADQRISASAVVVYVSNETAIRLLNPLLFLNSITKAHELSNIPPELSEYQIIENTHFDELKKMQCSIWRPTVPSNKECIDFLEGLIFSKLLGDGVFRIDAHQIMYVSDLGSIVPPKFLGEFSFTTNSKILDSREFRGHFALCFVRNEYGDKPRNDPSNRVHFQKYMTAIYSDRKLQTASNEATTFESFFNKLTGSTFENSPKVGETEQKKQVDQSTVLSKGHANTSVAVAKDYRAVQPSLGNIMQRDIGGLREYIGYYRNAGMLDKLFDDCKEYLTNGNEHERLRAIYMSLEIKPDDSRILKTFQGLISSLLDQKFIVSFDDLECLYSIFRKIEKLHLDDGLAMIKDETYLGYGICLSVRSYREQELPDLIATIFNREWKFKSLFRAIVKELDEKVTWKKVLPSSSYREQMFRKLLNQGFTEKALRRIIDNQMWSVVAYSFQEDLVRNERDALQVSECFYLYSDLFLDVLNTHKQEMTPLLFEQVRLLFKLNYYLWKELQK